MRWLVHHPQPLALLGVVLLAVLFLSLETRGNDFNTGMLDVLGGRLPRKAVESLERINGEIRTAKAILQADAQTVSILSAENRVRRFAFTGGTLWADGVPVISKLNRFHFEFRDGYNNLLTRSDANRHEIQTVVYLLNLNHRAKRVMGSARIPLSAVNMGGPMLAQVSVP